MLEKKLKHLDFLQISITRMNVNSFLIKGWSVTLIAAMFAFSAKDANNKYVLITFLTTVIFWLMDAYFLSLERQYRALYDVVRLLDEQQIDFDMNVTPYNKGRGSWLWSFFAVTLSIFYVTILVLVGLVYIILG